MSWSTSMEATFRSTAASARSPRCSPTSWTTPSIGLEARVSQVRSRLACSPRNAACWWRIAVPAFPLRWCHTSSRRFSARKARRVVWASISAAITSGNAGLRFGSLRILTGRGFAGGDSPPDGLIFDWEGPGFGSATNVAVLRDVLTQTIALIQVYTRLSHEEVDGHLEDLRREFPDRVLPTLTKADVTPADLRDKVRNARAGTIAGSIADAVRGHVRRALEGTLIEMCTMPQAGISAVVEGNAENLLSLMLAKVRDLLGVDASEILMKAAEGTPTAESTLALRRLLSAWYYFFPSDDRVRRGDIVETIGGGTELRFVVTPSCDLVRFRKKTGGVLTLLTAVALDTAGKDRLRKAALLPTAVRGSITAGVDGSGEAGPPL